MKKQLGKTIGNIAILICLGIVVFSVWKLYGYYRTYHNGKKEYDDLSKYIAENELTGKDEGKTNVSDDNEEKSDPEKKRCPVKVDFEALKKINPDVVGWIYIPDTGINYPIVQSMDNSAYLHKTFRGADSYVGAIFLDAMCDADFASFNSIIYGHNLKNGEMFGHLKNMYDVEYNSKADYKEHPAIWIITPDGACEYRVFAFREIDANADSDVYTVELSDPEARSAFFDKQIGRSQMDTGIRPGDDEDMITLSTCTSRTEGGRFIVQAVKE